MDKVYVNAASTADSESMGMGDWRDTSISNWEFATEEDARDFLNENLKFAKENYSFVNVGKDGYDAYN